MNDLNYSTNQTEDSMNQPQIYSLDAVRSLAPSVFADHSEGQPYLSRDLRKTRKIGSLQRSIASNMKLWAFADTFVN